MDGDLPAANALVLAVASRWRAPLFQQVHRICGAPSGPDPRQAHHVIRTYRTKSACSAITRPHVIDSREALTSTAAFDGQSATTTKIQLEILASRAAPRPDMPPPMIGYHIPLFRYWVTPLTVSWMLVWTARCLLRASIILQGTTHGRRCTLYARPPGSVGSLSMLY
jgi:hypothetical protein